MKKFLLMSSSLVLLNVAPVFAEEDNSARIAEIENQLKELDAQREELAKELETLQGGSENKDVQILETKNFIAGFSNARIEGDYLLVDLDFENISDKAATLWTDFSFALRFEQEGDVEVYKTSVMYSDKLGEVEGRKQVTMDTKIKAGASVKLLLVFDEFDPELPLMISSTSLTSDNPESIYLDFK